MLRCRPDAGVDATSAGSSEFCVQPTPPNTDGRCGYNCGGDGSSTHNGSCREDDSCCDDGSHGGDSVCDVDESSSVGGGHSVDVSCVINGLRGGHCYLRLLNSYETLSPVVASWMFVHLDG